MNWDAIGAVGELIGAVAVVVSLAYLATQVRNQIKESRLVAVHEIQAAFRESIQGFTVGDLADVFAKGEEDWSSLTLAETIKLLGGILPMLRLWEEAFIQHEQGRLERRIWEGINSQYSSYLNYGVVSKSWELRGQHFDRKFQDHVNGTEKLELKTG